MSKFREASDFQAETADWQLLPFRFERLGGRVLVTNLVGEHLFVSARGLRTTSPQGGLPSDSPFVRQLRAKHVIRESSDDLPVELLALKARTRYRRLAEFTSLHIFVASLRCEHSCPYCQVSRQSSDRRRLRHELGDRCASRWSRYSPRPPHNIKIEFQGGEPLLNFELIEEVVLAAKARNETEAAQSRFRDRHQPRSA